MKPEIKAIIAIAVFIAAWSFITIVVMVGVFPW
jgi:hypothetical protein